MATSQGEEREQFFSALYRLDHLSDEEDVPVPTIAPLQHLPAANVAPGTVSVQRRLALIVSTQALPMELLSITPTAADVEPPQKAIKRKRRPATARISPPLASSNTKKRKTNTMGYGPLGVPETSEAEPGDALDQNIHEMTDMQDVPLDLSDDHAATDSTSFNGLDSDSNRSDRPPKHKRSRKTGKPNQFMCLDKNDGSNKDMNPNALTIKILQKMASYYDRVGDSWRTLAYRRCMSALRRETRLVSTKEQAMQIWNIGDRLAAKIEEIVRTNTLRRLENTTTEPNDKCLQLFMGIYQVGYSLATKWIAQGHRTLEDLKTKVDLTPNQRIGVEHYDDFLQRIPRVEVAEHAEIVRNALEEVDPYLQSLIGGSYRRGNTDCGDIDILITKEGASLANIRTIILDTVVPKLTESGFLKAALATGNARLHSSSKWHGASALPRISAPWRRIDLLFVPWSELGAALIYFTGNDIFNRSMRLLASKRGMRLNQRGLYGDVMRGPRRECITEGKLLEGHSEKKIFDILGLPWRPPEHRKC
jgi:DNA polymerase IV